MSLVQRPEVLIMNLNRDLQVTHFIPTADSNVRLWEYERSNPLPISLEKALVYKPEAGYLLLTSQVPDNVKGWQKTKSTRWADSSKKFRDSLIQNAINSHLRKKETLKIGRDWSFDHETITENNGLESTIYRCASFGYVEVNNHDTLYYDFVRKVRSNLSIGAEIERGISPYGESIDGGFGDDVMVSVASSKGTFYSGELKNIRVGDSINLTMPGSSDTYRDYLASNKIVYSDKSAENTFLIDVKHGKKTLQYASDRVFRILRIEEWIGNLQQSMKKLLRLTPTQFTEHSNKGRKLLRGFLFAGVPVVFGFNSELEWNVHQADASDICKVEFPTGSKNLLWNGEWHRHLKHHSILHKEKLPEVTVTYCVAENDLAVLDQLAKYSESVFSFLPDWKHVSSNSVIILKGDSQTEIKRSISAQVSNLSVNKKHLIISGLRPSRPNADIYTWLKRELTSSNHVHQNYQIRQNDRLKAPDKESTHLMNLCQLLMKFGRLPVPFSITEGDIDLTISVDIGRSGKNRSRPAMAVSIDRFGTVWGGNISSDPQPGEEMSDRTIRDLFQNQVTMYESETGKTPKRVMVLRDGVSSSAELEAVNLVSAEYHLIGIDIIWITVQKTGVPRLLNYDNDSVSDILPPAQSYLVTSENSSWCWTTGTSSGKFPGIPRGFGFRVEQNFKTTPIPMELLSRILIAQAKSSQINPYSNTRLPFTLHLADKMAKALARGSIPPNYSGKGFPAC